jgi:hypothetical protein
MGPDAPKTLANPDVLMVDLARREAEALLAGSKP